MAAAARETARHRAERSLSSARARSQSQNQPGGGPQLDLGLPPRPLRLSIDLRNLPLDRYRLPRDIRGWKQIARDRMALAGWLATYGNPDGSDILPSIPSMMNHFGWSHGKTCYLLRDLEELKLLCDDGRKVRSGTRGTRKRKMDIAAFVHAATIQNAEQQSNLAAPPSNHELDATVPTVQTENQNPGAQTARLTPAPKPAAVSLPDQAKEIEDRRKIEARDRREKQEALARSKDTIVRIEANVGAGPEAPPPRYCKQCGRTKFFHAISRENQKRHDPRWEPHEFVPESATWHEARAG